MDAMGSSSKERLMLLSNPSGSSSLAVKGPTLVGSGLILLNTAFGASLLTLPYIVKTSGGVVPFIVIQYSVATLAMISMFVLAKFAHDGNCSLPREIVASVLKSSTWDTIYALIILTDTYLGSIVHLTICADQSEKIVELATGTEFFDQHYLLLRRLAIVILGVSIFPFLVPKSIKMLQLPGILTCVSSVSVICLVFYIYFFQTHQKIEVEILNLPRNPLELSAVFPMLVFCYDCHATSIVTYASLGRRRKSVRNWSKVILGVALWISLSFTVVGIMGYLSFGDSVHDDFLLNCSGRSIPAVIARCAIMISLLMSYIEGIFLCRRYTEDLHRKFAQLSFEEGEKSWTTRYYLQTVFLFSTTIFFTLIVGGFADIGNIVGIFGSMTIFGLPGLCLLVKYTRRTPSHGQLAESEGKDQGDEIEDISTMKRVLYLMLACVLLLAFAFVFSEGILSEVSNVIKYFKLKR